ncbi:uncharacterized protein N7477_007541 [Penicillium maclennaniae]|uniref:uncharacterized protein n=1 Tax=Penicillium maclennaniae TaxID=1343394 RepID=UPI00253F9B59|nr:uncharacterized protein N7477_007541 [Penicillium maclennaniae]KAJ5665093.1 hypothetical protein N7477_007541 [Penicillium maclennaniae]
MRGGKRELDEIFGLSGLVAQLIAKNWQASIDTSIFIWSCSYDPYMGLNPKLLLLIDQVAELTWICGDEQDKIGVKTVLNLNGCLEESEQRMPVEHLSSNTECAAIAEANRLGALLLLHANSSPESVCSLHPPTLNDEEQNG